MTQSTKGPENVPGSNDGKKDAAARRDPSDNSPKSAAQASGSNPNSGTRHDSPAQTPKGVPSAGNQGRTNEPRSSNPPGSRSPGSLPGENSSGQRRDAGGTSTDGNDRSSGPAGATSPKVSPDVRPAPSPSTGVSPVRSGENRPMQAPARGTPGGNQSPSARSDSGSPKGRSESQPSGPNESSPQDPKRFGQGDPVQPNRSVPTQPSRVTEPTVGAAGATGAGDDES